MILQKKNREWGKQSFELEPDVILSSENVWSNQSLIPLLCCLTVTFKYFHTHFSIYSTHRQNHLHRGVFRQWLSLRAASGQTLNRGQRLEERDSGKVQEFLITFPWVEQTDHCNNIYNRNGSLHSGKAHNGVIFWVLTVTGVSNIYDASPCCCKVPQSWHFNQGSWGVHGRSEMSKLRTVWIFTLFTLDLFEVWTQRIHMTSRGVCQGV